MKIFDFDTDFIQIGKNFSCESESEFHFLAKYTISCIKTLPINELIYSFFQLQQSQKKQRS